MRLTKSCDMIAQSIEGSKAGYLAFPAPSKSNTEVLSHMGDEYGNCKASFVPARRFFTVALNCRNQDMPDPSRAFGRIPGIFIRKRPVRHAILCKPLPTIRPPVCQFLQRMPLRKETNAALFSPACKTRRMILGKSQFCNNLWFCDTNRRKMYGEEP